MYPIYCLGCIKIVNLQGRLKSSRKLSSELTFDFQIESIGKLVFVISVEYLIRLFTITTQLLDNCQVFWYAKHYHMLTWSSKAQ